MPEVAVIGGGIVGSSAAYHLARAGVTTALIDRGDRGQATAAGAGIICPATGRTPPPAFLPLSAESIGYYPQLLDMLAGDGETETGYDVPGAVFVATTDEEAARLPDMAVRLQERHRTGTPNLGDVSVIDSARARELFPPLADVAAAIHIPGAARVNGRLMRDALQRAAEGHGAQIIKAGAHVVLEGDIATHVRTDEQEIPVESVILATGAWSSSLRLPGNHSLPVYPQRGQILHLDVQARTDRWSIVLGFHSHYILTFPPHRVVAGATREDEPGYDPRVTAAGVQEALREALRVAPGLASATLTEVRVGLRPATRDGLPLLGRLPGARNVYVATGHGPSGLQLGPFAGMMAAGWVRGLPSPIDPGPFAPDRTM